MQNTEPIAPPESIPPPDAAFSDRVYVRIAAGIALCALLIRVWIAWTTHYTAEDYLITLRYAENLAQGRGFTFNPGERVLGTTTPLYTLILAAIAFLRLDALDFGKILNLAADSFTCFLLARLLARRAVGQPIAGLFAACLYAGSPLAIKTTVGGMEAGLVTCCGLGALLAFVDGKEWRLAVLSAALLLLRVDAAPLTALLWVGFIYSQKRVPVRALLLGALLVLPWLLFAKLYFGAVIPNTIFAKIEVYRRLLPASAGMNFPAFAIEFLGPTQRFFTLFTALGAARVLYEAPLWFRRRPKAQAGILFLPLVWLLFYYGVLLRSPVPAFYWYFLPPYPLYFGFAALGGAWPTEGAARLLRVKANSGLRKAWLPALALLALASAARLRSVRAPILVMQYVEDEGRVPMALWLRDNVPPGQRILLEPIGYVGYYAGHPLLDMIGLVSPEVLPSYRQPKPLADIIDRYRPEWLLLRDGEIGMLNQQDSAILAGRYAKTRLFSLPDGSERYTLFHRTK